MTWWHLEGRHQHPGSRRCNRPARDQSGNHHDLPAATLHRVWRMLTHNHGQLFNAAQIEQALGSAAHTTIGRYLDLFVDAMMLRQPVPKSLSIAPLRAPSSMPW